MRTILQSLLQHLFSRDSALILISLSLATLALAWMISVGELAGGAQLQLQLQGFDALSQAVFAPATPSAEITMASVQ